MSNPEQTPVVADIDGTFMRSQLFSEYVHEMADAGLLPRISVLKAEESLHAYKRREGRFDDFTNAQVKAYQEEARMKDIRVSDAEFVAKRLVAKNGKHVHVFPRELLRAAQDIGMPRAFISGSQIQVVAALASLYHVTAFLGTEHPQANGRFTGERQKEWCLDKKEAILELAKRHAFDLTDAVAIGDSMGDVGMFEQVRYPICFNPNKKLLALARTKGWAIVIERKDSIICLRSEPYTTCLSEIPIADLVSPTLGQALVQCLGQHLTQSTPSSDPHIGAFLFRLSAPEQCIKVSVYEDLCLTNFGAQSHGRPARLPTFPRSKTFHR